MKFYEPFQRLDFGYMKTPNELLIYLRATVSVYLPRGVTLMGYTSGASPNWTMDYYLLIDNIAEDNYLWEKPELIYLSRIPLPATADPQTMTDSVRQEIVKMLNKPKLFTVVTNVYNEKKVLEGQVTNTISNQGEIISI